MQALFRKFGEKYYVWKDVTWKAGAYYITDNDGFEYDMPETSILAIRNDNRAGKVMCKYCNELIDNNPEAIEKHFADNEAKKDCMTCSKIASYMPANGKVSYTSNGDGTYKENRVQDVKLKCKMSAWETYDIHSANINSICMHTQHRRQGVTEVHDFFMQYPDAFDKQITSDVLINRNYEFERHRNGFFEYDVKLRGALKACVNELGVVDHFIITHRDYSYVVYYSHKYDKLFFNSRDMYNENMPNRMSESKYNNVKTRIKALYEEANK